MEIREEIVRSSMLNWFQLADPRSLTPTLDLARNMVLWGKNVIVIDESLNSRTKVLAGNLSRRLLFLISLIRVSQI